VAPEEAASAAGYQLAGLFSGAIAPIVSIALVAKFHTPYAVSIYVLAMLALTMIALRAAPETARRDLHEDTPDTPATDPWHAVFPEELVRAGRGWSGGLGRPRGRR